MLHDLREIPVIDPSATLHALYEMLGRFFRSNAESPSKISWEVTHGTFRAVEPCLPGNRTVSARVEGFGASDIIPDLTLRRDPAFQELSRPRFPHIFAHAGDVDYVSAGLKGHDCWSDSPLATQPRGAARRGLLLSSHLDVSSGLAIPAVLRPHEGISCRAHE
jgi:hypothetical protein